MRNGPCNGCSTRFRACSAVEDPHRERKGDLSDLVGRLRMNLRHDASSPRDLFKDFDEPCVLIADELTPSMAAQLDWSHIRAFATDAGSRTYHTAILARPSCSGRRGFARCQPASHTGDARGHRWQ